MSYIDTELSFSASYAGVEVAGPTLKIIPPRIRFLRYGYRFKANENFVVAPDTYPPSVSVPGYMPYLNNYKIEYTSIGEGYIYIYNEQDPQQVLREYKTDEKGNMYPVIWDGEGAVADVRDKIGRSEDGYAYMYDSQIWVCFAPVQLSVRQLENLKNDAGAREEFMKKITCTGLAKGEMADHNNVIPYDELKVFFTDDQIAEKNWLQERLNDLKVKSADKLYRNDLWVVLQDPLACADDLSLELIKEFIKLDAIVESLQTGIDDEVLYEQALKGSRTSSSSSVSDKNKALQISSLFSLAATTYQMVYNSDEMKKDYGKHIDLGRIQKILGVEERKAQREKIQELRNDFGTFLTTEYAHSSLPFFIDNTDERAIDGKSRYANYMLLLSKHPQDVDRALDLHDDHKGAYDRWATYYNDSLEGIGSGYDIQLLLRKADVNVINSSAYALKVTDTMNKLLEAYIKYVKDEKQLDLLLKYVKFVEFKKQKNVLQLKRKEFDAVLHKYNLMLDQEKDVYLRRNNKRAYLQIKLKDASKGKDAFEKDGAVRVHVTNRLNDIDSRIDAFINSPNYQAVISKLALLEAMINYYQLARDPNLKDSVSAAASTWQIIEATKKYEQALAKAQGSNVKGVVILSKGARFVTPSLGLGMAVWDVYDCFSKRDIDAGLAFAAVAAINGVFLLQMGGVITLAFWPAAILFGVMLIAIALAIYFKDTPIEFYFKHFILSKNVKFAEDKGEKPWQFIQRLYLASTQKDNKILYKQWKTIDEVYTALQDILVSYRVEGIISDYDLPAPNSMMINHMGHMMGPGQRPVKAREIKVYCTLKKFLQEQSEFECEMRLYPFGLDASNDYYMLEPEKPKLIKRNGTEVFELTYKIDDRLYDKITLRSKCFFLSKALIDPDLGEYWPLQKHGQRFHAFRISPVDFPNNFSRTILGDHDRVGTKGEVLAPEFWQKRS